MTDALEVDKTARALLGLLGTGAQRSGIVVADMASAGRIVARIRALREAGGEHVVGRKIGFSNTDIWPLYGVDRPIWNYMWDSTVQESRSAEAQFDLSGLAEPRIEPEVVLHLSRTPETGMDEADLLHCIDRVAPGFEIVQSVFPGWKFTAASSCAAFGLHGGLVVGPWYEIGQNHSDWAARLASFSVTLEKDGRVVETGQARKVLDGGPIAALRYLVETIHDDPAGVALAAGEIVTTGTLTDAYPVAPGEIWTTVFRGIGLGGLRVGFRTTPSA